MKLYDFFWEVFILSLMGSVLAGVIILIKSLFKGKLSAGWHYYIWILLFARLVIPYAPQADLSIFNLFMPVIEQIDSKGMVPGYEIPASIPNENEAYEGIRPESGSTGGSGITWTDDSDTAEAIGLSFGAGFGWKDLIGFLWISGIFIMALSIIISNRVFTFRARKSPRCRDERILRIMRACANTLGIKGEIPVLLKHGIKTPLLFGLSKPALLSSEVTLKAMTDEEMRFVFMHELMHLKRKDILINWLMTIIKCIYWFNPFIWYAFYRIKEDCEVSCDESVLLKLNPPEYKKYGETIISLTRLMTSPVSRTCTTGIAGRKSSIKRRINMIAGFKKKSLIWSVLAIVLTLFVGCSSLTGAKTGTDPDNSPQGQNISGENTPVPGEKDEDNDHEPQPVESAVPDQDTPDDEKDINDMSAEEKVDYYMNKLKDKTFTGTYGDGYTWYTAAEELGMIGKPAIPSLIERLDTSDDYERALVIYGLLLASQQENVKAFTNGEYIDVNLDFNPENHPDMVKKAMDWWNKYKSNF